MEIEARILAQAKRRFMQYGVRSITMDDLAKDLGISKKTIYQSFENKAAVVYQVTLSHFEEEKALMEEIAQAAENALDELMRVCLWSYNAFKNISPNLPFEIRKYYPKSWKIIDDYMQVYVLEEVRNNLVRGQLEGLYREEINIDIVSRIRVSQFDMSIRESFFPPDQFDNTRVQMEMFAHYIYGIVTEKGRKLLDAFFQETHLIDYLKSIDKDN
ncbi:MAG: TetR/AcrR family transcriptional regulator [Bacteroidota bacterium]